MPAGDAHEGVVERVSTVLLIIAFLIMFSQALVQMEAQ